ncbi:hypothetical protein F5Y10DRAFT_110782 [Nemania abortiva]|nr:hypothetical protein F5Y10DRAFT_110782 [Nemania abortiva]
MFRLGIPNTLFRGSQRGRWSPLSMAAPHTMSSCQTTSSNMTRTQPRGRSVMSFHNKKCPEHTSRPHFTGPPNTKPYPRWVFVGNEWCRVPFGGSWTSTLDPEIRINYQDVRGHGPLFDPKAELNADPEKAKEQWRELCQAYRQKQGIATALWEKNRELEARLRAAEAACVDKDDKLASVSVQRDDQMKDNMILCDKLRQMKTMVSGLRYNKQKWLEDYGLQETKRRMKARNHYIRYWSWTLALGLFPLVLCQLMFPLKFF